MFVRLSKDSHITNFSIHRLVGMAFIPNPENKPNINHKNAIKADNRVENIEWCTQKENIIHSYKMGLQPIIVGEDHYKTKLNEFQVRVIRKAKVSYKYLGEIFGISKGCINNIRSRRNWKHI